MDSNDELADWYDVVVVGGGTAGLSGAVALSRARRRVLVVDAGSPRNAAADAVHNYLTRDGTAPAELLAAGRAEVRRYGGQVSTGTVTAARRLTGQPGPGDPADAGGAGSVHTGPNGAGSGGQPGGFALDLADGRVLRARRLLIATGLADELPALPGLAERFGRDVLHCPYCHGWEVRDQAIGVLATGPMAVQQALLWRQWSADITLFQHTTADPTPEQREQLGARGITVVAGEVAAVEVHADRLTGVRLRDGQVVARAALVVAPRFTARGGLLAGLGLEPTDHLVGEHVIGSRIAADPTGATAVAGVWVAGNVADPLAQVISSAAAGLGTGAAINADLIAEDTRQAVAARRDRVPA